MINQRPEAAHQMKITLNRVCKNKELRYHSWKAILSRPVVGNPFPDGLNFVLIEGREPSIPLQIHVFEKYT